MRRYKDTETVSGSRRSPAIAAADTSGVTAGDNDPLATPVAHPPSRLDPRLAAAGRAVAAPLALLVLGVLLTHGYYQRRVLVGNDVRELWLPTWTFLGHSLSSGHVPLWDPHVLSGRPFAADPQSGWLYLMPMALFTALPAHTAIRLMIVLPPILAALALYAFCRIEGMPRIAGFCGGAALLGLTTPDTMLVRPPFEGTLLYAMTTLACAAWLLRARTPLSRVCALVAFGLSYSQAISAHLSLGLLEVTLLTGGYLLVKVIPVLRGRGGREILRAAGLAAGVVLATALISAGVLLPRLALIPRTNLAHGYDDVWRMGLELAGLPAAGTVPVQQAARVGAWPLWLFVDSGAQLPLLAGALVVIGLLSRRRGLAAMLALLGLLSYLLTLSSVAGAVPASWERFRPVDFYRHGPGWFSYLAFAVLALMTALGAERLVEWLDERQARVPGAALVAGAVAALIAVQLVVGLPSRDAPRGVPTALLSPQGATSTPRGDPGSLSFQRQFRNTGRIAVYYHSGTRFSALSGAFPAPASTTFDLADVTGSDSVSGYDAVQLARYWRTLRLYDHALLPYDRTALTHLTPAFADLLNVGWWVAPPGVAPPPGAVLKAKHPAGRLWQLRPPGPASLYPAWQGAVSDAAAQHRVVHGLDPRTTVVVPGLASGGVAGPRRPVSVSESDQGTVTATTNAPTPGLLMVRNTYDPGWRATVDGHSARVYAANGFLLGVKVPAGRHRVVLTYGDAPVFWGLWISIAAIGALLIGGFLVDRGGHCIWGRRPTR